MKKYWLIGLYALALTSCDSFLNCEPENSFSSEGFLESESDLRLYTNGFLKSFLPSEETIAWGGDQYADFCATRSSTTFLIGDTWDDTQQGGWGTGDWGDLRQINYFLDNLPNAKGKVTDATYLHNEGVGRFWRAYFYYGMVRTFGDVPWYETTLDVDNRDELYKPRDKREVVMDKILEDPADTSFDLEPLVFKSLKKKLPELRDAIDGYITPEQAGKLKVIKAHYENLEARKAELEELILALATPYQQELAILQTAPGISSDFTAIGIISEIGTNMEAFPSAKHLCSWAGLTPTNNESAGKKKSVRVSKAGCYIKPLLVQCANAVVKSNKHPEIRNRYLRIKKRRGHKKAIIAIARMLLTALYHILKNGENYNAELYRKSDLPPVDREITVEQALMIARNQGYKIKSATA